MTLSPIILGYGLTIDEACFNFVTGDTYFVCSGFTSFSSQTIPYIISETSGNTVPVSTGYYSDGNMVRYFSSTGDTTGGVLCEAYLCRRSEYLRDCCNNKLYKLKSGKLLPVDALISIKPVYFCYRVVEEPKVPLRFDILNDSMGYLIFPSTYQCDAAECQPCDCLTGNTRNDCDPITLFPLEIKCDVTNPTEALPYSGKVSAIVIGGTQPYMYTWTLPDGRQIHNQTITNVTDGTYHLVVVDKYGDFTASTDCTISTYIDCTFSGSVTEIFPEFTTTTTIDYTCYCYIIENNYNGPLITTTTTYSGVPGCEPYCIQNISQTGNGITDTFIFTYTDCYGNLTQRLLAQGNTALIYTLDISSYTVEWVDSVGTPPERWTDYTVNFGEGNCANSIIARLGEIIVDYYDCFSGRTSMILPNGEISICSYTEPTIYSSVSGVTITKNGLCKKAPCPIPTPTNIITTSTTYNNNNNNNNNNGNLNCTVWYWQILNYDPLSGPNVPLVWTNCSNTQVTEIHHQFESGTICVYPGTFPTLGGVGIPTNGNTLTQLGTICYSGYTGTTTTIAPTTTTTPQLTPTGTRTIITTPTPTPTLTLTPTPTSTPTLAYFNGTWIWNTTSVTGFTVSSCVINGTSIGNTNTVGGTFPIQPNKVVSCTPPLTPLGGVFIWIPSPTITLNFTSWLANPGSPSSVDILINGIFALTLSIPYGVSSVSTTSLIFSPNDTVLFQFYL